MTTAKKPRRTFHRGASIDRQSVLRKLRRDENTAAKLSADLVIYIRALRAWVEDRPSRYRRRPGGL